MEKVCGVHFGMDDKVVGIFYASLLKDLLEREGFRLKGYDGCLSDFDDTKRRISPRKLYQIMFLSLQNAPTGIGLLYGNKLNLVAADTVGQLIMSCSNLRQAFESIKTFQTLLAVSIDMETKVVDGKMLIKFAPLYNKGVVGYLKHFLTEVLFTSIMTQARWLTGRDLGYTKLYIPYQKPGYSALYDEMFDCDIEYEALFHGLEFDAAILDMPILSANDQLKKVKAKRCADALRNWERRFSIENRVKSILLKTFPDFPNLEDVAEQLNLSRSCLYRKLQLSGTSYQSLVTTFRQEQSLILLRHTSLTISQIAEDMGFSDASSSARI